MINIYDIFLSQILNYIVTTIIHTNSRSYNIECTRRLRNRNQTNDNKPINSPLLYSHINNHYRSLSCKYRDHWAAMTRSSATNSIVRTLVQFHWVLRTNREKGHTITVHEASSKAFPTAAGVEGCSSISLAWSSF